MDQYCTNLLVHPLHADYGVARVALLMPLNLAVSNLALGAERRGKVQDFLM
jgi:hypothetical protein